MMADAVLQTNLPGIINGCITPLSCQAEIMHSMEKGKPLPSNKCRTTPLRKQCPREHLRAIILQSIKGNRRLRMGMRFKTNPIL